MNLVQALPVIFGANIGTTVTAQLIAFKLTDYALPIVGIGVAIYLFAKRKSTKNIGETILGFGILFLGLTIMSQGVAPLGESPMMQEVFAKFSHNPILAILVGAIATGIVQSSSVSTGIVLTLAGVGLLDFSGAIYIVMGANIGTCVTALLASIGTNLSARRVAMSHLIFNVMGTMIAMVLLPLYMGVALNSSSELMRQIANFHTIFNVGTSLIFIGFVPLYAKLITKIVPGKEVIIEMGPKYLDKNLLGTPSIAIDAAKKEILRALELSKEMVGLAMNAFYKGNSKDISEVLVREDLVDELQTSITKYLINVTERELNEDEANMIPSLLHSINDIERIADHAVNISEFAEKKIDQNLKFSKSAEDEIRKIDEIIREMLDDAIAGLPEMSKTHAMQVIAREERVDNLVAEYRVSHCERMSKGTCHPISGLVFVDILMNLEKIGDHLTNLAESIEGKFSWSTSNYNEN
jgi:phosphate:Na+ symporter